VRIALKVKKEICIRGRIITHTALELIRHPLRTQGHLERGFIVLPALLKKPSRKPGYRNHTFLAQTFDTSPLQGRLDHFAVPAIELVRRTPLQKRKPGNVMANLKACLDELARDPNQEPYQLLFAPNTSWNAHRSQPRGVIRRGTPFPWKRHSTPTRNLALPFY